ARGSIPPESPDRAPLRAHPTRVRCLRWRYSLPARARMLTRETLHLRQQIAHVLRVLAVLARGDVLHLGGRFERGFFQCRCDLLTPCRFELACERRDACIGDGLLDRIGGEE